MGELVPLIMVPSTWYIKRSHDNRELFVKTPCDSPQPGRNLLLHVYLKENPELLALVTNDLGELCSRDHLQLHLPSTDG